MSRYATLVRNNGSVKRLAEYLRQYKEDNGLSNEQMAEMIDTDVSTIRDWINEKYPPSSKSWKKLIKAFGEPIRDIMIEKE